MIVFFCFFFSSRRRHTRCALVTGVQTCALPISDLRQKRMIPILTRIRAHSAREFGELVRHQGEEFIYVLEGRIEVHSEYYDPVALAARSEEHTSELQSLMRISYAVFCLKKKKTTTKK